MFDSLLPPRFAQKGILTLGVPPSYVEKGVSCLIPLQPQLILQLVLKLTNSSTQESVHQFWGVEENMELNGKWHKAYLFKEMFSDGSGEWDMREDMICCFLAERLRVFLCWLQYAAFMLFF